MSTPPVLSSTSYAILGLLAIKPWTTHELVQQVDRSLRRIWPRAQSKLYEEPKKLVAHGYARADEDPVGRRRRTRYTITANGRRALATWLHEPGDGPLLEFEQLLKISFAESGSTADILTNLAAVRQWAHAENEENLATARAYRAGQGAFPERAALNQLGGRFLTDYYLMVARWAEWAGGVVAGWPDDPLRAEFDPAVQDEAIRLAEITAEITAEFTARGWRIALIGPTSSPWEEVSEGVQDDLARLARTGVELEYRLTGAGPRSITTAEDAQAAAPHVVAAVLHAQRDGFDAAIVDCTDDPGVEAARSEASIPVIGTGEALRRAIAAAAPPVAMLPGDLLRSTDPAAVIEHAAGAATVALGGSGWSHLAPALAADGRTVLDPLDVALAECLAVLARRR